LARATARCTPPSASTYWSMSVAPSSTESRFWNDSDTSRERALHQRGGGDRRRLHAVREALAPHELLGQLVLVLQRPVSTSRLTFEP
jgi:hypothetical protein